MGFFKHESAVVDEGAVIGEGSKVWHFCHVSTGARIGIDCTLGQNVYVAATGVVGNRVRIQNNVSIYDGVILEDDVFVGPSAVFTNVINPRSEVSRKAEYRPTRVHAGVTIGANATILCGTTLGSYAFVGAGAVVTHDVKPFALVVGVPAHQIGWVCRCGVRLYIDARGDAARLAAGEGGVARESRDSTAGRCAECGRSYRLDGDELVEA